MCACVCVPEEEREQVERLRWPSRGYLQELSEYQQRRRKLRKSRCIVMWPLLDAKKHLRRTKRVGGGEGSRGGRPGRNDKEWEPDRRNSLFSVCPAGWRADCEGHCCRGNRSERLLNQSDSVVEQWLTPPWHASLLPEERLCVLCLMTFPTWAIQNDWSLLPNMNKKITGQRLCEKMGFLSAHAKWWISKMNCATKKWPR